MIPPERDISGRTGQPHARASSMDRSGSGLPGSERAAALAECLRRYGRMVQRTALRTVRDAHLAEDVCQAVFLVLVRKAETLRQVASLGGWLHRAAVLAARKTVEAEVRRKRREEKVAMTPATARGPAELPDGFDRALDRLPAVYRQAIIAHYLEGQSHAQIASRLGVPEKTVRSRTSKGPTGCGAG